MKATRLAGWLLTLVIAGACNVDPPRVWNGLDIDNDLEVSVVLTLTRPDGTEAELEVIAGEIPLAPRKSVNVNLPPEVLDTDDWCYQDGDVIARDPATGAIVARVRAPVCYDRSIDLSEHAIGASAAPNPSS